MLNGVGVVPKYQGVGANAVLYTELVKILKSTDFAFQHADYVQVADTNIESLRDAIAIRMKWFGIRRSCPAGWASSGTGGSCSPPIGDAVLT